MSELIRLTKAAHERAIQSGGACPHERSEFNHLPMRWEGDIPVFDASRMTDDQVWDTEEALRRMLPDMGTKQGSVREAVKDHMVAYGRFGLRVKDVCSAVAASKPVVLKYLRELEEAGEVYIKEEANPRKGASARKRYFLVDSQPVFGAESFLGEDLTPRTDRSAWDQEKGSGICHHGTAVSGLMCPHQCEACLRAVEEALVGEAVTAARKAGGSGFAEGLALRTSRRLAADAIWEKAAREMGIW